MKNLLAIFLMAILFASCEGPAGAPGKDGQGIWWHVTDPIKVNSNQWELGENAEGVPFYFYEYNIKELDGDVYDGGKVQVRMFLDFDTNIEAIAPLEHTEQRQDKDGNKYNEIYGYEYYPGGIMFTVKFGDFITEQRPPTQYFQVVLNY